MSIAFLSGYPTEDANGSLGGWTATAGRSFAPDREERTRERGRAFLLDRFRREEGGSKTGEGPHLMS